MQQREHPKLIQTRTFKKNQKHKLTKITSYKKIKNINAKTTDWTGTDGVEI